MRYSVIDISSSGVSYIVADTADDGSPSAEIILKDRIYLGLSFFMDGNILTDEGIDKLCDCLGAVRDTCVNIGVRRCVVVSTASLRNITNCEEAESEIMSRLGLYVNYIDGGTEAYCDYAANVFYAGMDSPVVIDVGGKSIEICDLGKTDKDDMTCLEFGLLDLRAKFVAGDNPTPDESDEIKKFVKCKFDDAGIPGEGVYKTAVLVGATCGAVYDVYQAFSKKQPKNGPKVMDRKTFKKMVRYLISDNGRSSLMLSVAPEKLALIIPASIVLRNLFKRFDVDTIIVSDRGVKEGYLSMLLNGAGDILVNETGERCEGVSESEGTGLPDYPSEAGAVGAAAQEDGGAAAETEDGTAEPVETVEESSESLTQDVDADETAWAEEVPEDSLAETEEGTAEPGVEPVVKRGRGRPRKMPAAGEGPAGDGHDGVAAVKRGRGRPRKNPDEVPVKVSTGKRGRPRKYPVADENAADAGDEAVPAAFDGGFTGEDTEASVAGGNGPADTAYDETYSPLSEEGAYAGDETYGDAEYEDEEYEDVEEAGGNGASEYEDTTEAAVISGSGVNPVGEAVGTTERENVSVQVTMDDFETEDEGGLESEDDFESELDEPVPVAEFDAAEAENPTAGEAAAVPEGTSGDAAEGAVTEAAKSPDPRPVRKERNRGSDAGNSAPARRGSPGGKAAANKKSSGSAGKTAKGSANGRSRSAEPSAPKAGAASAQAPVEPAVEVPVAPVYTEGPGEEVPSDRFRESNVAPYVDVYTDSTDESVSFSDFEPVEVTEAEGGEPAAPDETDAVDGLGLSGMTDMDENFSAVSDVDADFADKDE